MNEQELRLSDELFAGLTAFPPKSVTVRTGHRPIQQAPLVFRGVSNELLTVTVAVDRVIHTRLRHVSPEDVEADGFLDHADMLQQMRRFYPDITEDSPVTVVRFTPPALGPASRPLGRRSP